MASTKQYERGASTMSRTNKHFASNYGSHDKKSVNQPGLNKYTSSVDNKHHYSSNPLHISNLQKQLKSKYI